MTEPRVLVSEIFGPTWQGEGPSIGQLAAFLRLSHCNMDCRWCDTPYTWDRTRFDLTSETRRMTAAKAVEELAAIPARLVVITGGEPLLQQNRLTWVVDMYRARGRHVEIETNGTVTPSRGLLAAVPHVNVSPKLANSGIAAHRRVNAEALHMLASSRKAVFKFVVEQREDLQEIAELESTCPGAAAPTAAARRGGRSGSPAAASSTRP